MYKQFTQALPGSKSARTDFIAAMGRVYYTSYKVTQQNQCNVGVNFKRVTA